jgi:anti-anti-sigma factor
VSTISEIDVPHDDPTAGSAPPAVCLRPHVDVGWVRVVGALDGATAAQLRRTLRERGLRTRLVVLDLRELTFMDWSGVQAVVDASTRARKAGRRLVVMHVAPQVKQMFVDTGNSEVIEIADLHLVESPPQTMLPPAGGDCAA